MPYVVSVFIHSTPLYFNNTASKKFLSPQKLSFFYNFLPAKLKQENFSARENRHSSKSLCARTRFSHKEGIGTGRKLYPRLGAYFTALSNERNKFPPFGSCLGAYVYTALRQFRPKPQPVEALSPPPVASPQTNANKAFVCSNSVCLFACPNPLRIS